MNIYGRGETGNKSKRNHVQITCGLKLGQELEKPLKEEKNKNGQSRNRYSNTPEISEDFLLLIRVTKEKAKAPDTVVSLKPMNPQDKE